MNTGDKFGFLDSANARTLLVDMWGNPPEAATNVLGVLVPKGFNPVFSWAVVITYEDIGHVADDDAGSMNADDVLKTLHEQQDAANEARKKSGFEGINLVGWARPPSYDSSQKKAIWALRLHEEGAAVDTLNYNIRVLGRSGVLVLNAIAAMTQLSEIEGAEHGILATTAFDPGKTYADYDSGTDTAATVGVAGLIAGGAAVAVKAGLLKGLLVALAAGWKFIAAGAVALIAFFRRLFKGRNSTPGAGPTTTT